MMMRLRRLKTTIRKDVILMADVKYEIVEKMGQLSESSKGWTKELNLISCNGFYEIGFLSMKQRDIFKEMEL